MFASILKCLFLIILIITDPEVLIDMLEASLVPAVVLVLLFITLSALVG